MVIVKTGKDEIKNNENFKNHLYSSETKIQSWVVIIQTDRMFDLKILFRLGSVLTQCENNWLAELFYPSDGGQWRGGHSRH